MIRKDYLVRQFEEFGKVMAMILRLKKDKAWDQMDEEISLAVTRFTELELRDLVSLDLPSFTQFIVDSQHLSDKQLRMLADLLYEKLQKELAVSEQDQSTQIKKLLFLYERLKSLATTNQFDLDVHYKVAALHKLLQ